jgi:glycosyltransferase involved in cell wall biosynthesis
MIPIFIFLSVSLIAITIYYFRLKQSLAAAPRLVAQIEINIDSLNISLVIPAYNEAENITECLLAVLQSTNLPASQLEVLVIDDRSNDNTLEIANNLVTKLQDDRLHIIEGKPRPEGESWVGKNWACTQAAATAKGDYLLFVDADVRLKQGAIEAAVNYAQNNKIDLLSLLMAIYCGCMAEWLVQPIMTNLLAVGFDYGAVNDPQDDNAFAAGPFMLFQRSAYNQIGGHRAVGGEVVEDVELARKIKQAGFKLEILLGSDYISARMYRNWGALWEGWTKNLYLGAQRHLLPILQIAGGVLLMYTLPWFCLPIIVFKILINDSNYFDYLSLALIVLIISIQYSARVLGGKNAYTPNSYWWLGSLGGIMVAAIAIASVIKTETGWGWTWRGRKLKISN